MKVKEGFVVRNVGGKTVAVASGELCNRFNGMITLNTTGELLFEMLRKGTTEEEMVNAIKENYGVEGKIAEADVKKFVGSLERAGLLEDGTSCG